MEPTTPGGYCRRCGGWTSAVVPAGDDRPRSVCGACGAIEYDNPKVVVACPLYEGDRILWIRRRTAPYAGCWAIPSGFMENGETLREAACREVLEETHLRVEPAALMLYGALSLPDIHQLYIALVAPLPSHDYGPSDEASEVRMIGRDEVTNLDLGYPEPTTELLLALYDVIARGELDPLGGRLWDIRGVDPGAWG